jgi:uncharacterized protein (DUF2141 family)
MALLMTSLASAGLARAQQPPPPSPSASATPIADRLEAEMLNLRNSNGSVKCALFASADGFPRDDDKAVASASAPIDAGHATCVFDGLQPGAYAIVVLHDENNDDQMDYDIFGLPTKGYAFSNDARGLLGAPSFESARFYYPGGRMTLPIRIRY